MAVERADDLYAVPLDEFVRERDGLARRLRADGDKDGAAAVKKMRKPAAAAWVTNQVARADGEVERLLAATADLAAAHRRAVESGDPEPLRDATRAHRVALDAVERAAREVVRTAGLNAAGPLLERVRDTAQSAAVDDADALRAGRLVDEGRPAGFGFEALGDLPAAATPPPGRRPEAPPAPRRPDPREVAAVRQRAEAAEREAARLRSRATELAAEAKRLRSRAEDAATAAAAADRRATKAEGDAMTARATADRLE